MSSITNRFRKQQGLSLIEIMIAMLISLFLLGGVIQVYSSTRITYQTNEGLSRLQENARFIFDRIATDLSAAGFLGCMDSNDRLSNGAFKIHNRLSQQGTAANASYDFSNPVDGIDANGPSNSGVNSDMLRVRRSVASSAMQLAAPYTLGDTSLLLVPGSKALNTLSQWQTLAISDCEKTSIFMVTNKPDPTVGVIEFDPNKVSPVGQINAGQSNIETVYKGKKITDLRGYYDKPGASKAVSYQIATTSYNICNGASGRLSLCMNGNELVEDVTDLQLLFGINTNGTPGPDQFVKPGSAALNAAGLNAVASMRVDLTLESGAVQVNGQPVQKVFSQIFRLRNR